MLLAVRTNFPADLRDTRKQRNRKIRKRAHPVPVLQCNAVALVGDEEAYCRMGSAGRPPGAAQLLLSSEKMNCDVCCILSGMLHLHMENGGMVAAAASRQLQ